MVEPRTPALVIVPMSGMSTTKQSTSGRYKNSHYPSPKVGKWFVTTSHHPLLTCHPSTYHFNLRRCFFNTHWPNNTRRLLLFVITWNKSINLQSQSSDITGPYASKSFACLYGIYITYIHFVSLYANIYTKYWVCPRSHVFFVTCQYLSFSWVEYGSVVNVTTWSNHLPDWYPAYLYSCSSTISELRRQINM